MLPAPLVERFLSALLAVPRIRDRNRRDELLANLPPNIVDGLNRDDTPRTDLNGTIRQLDKLGRLTATGERPLVIVGQAAFPYVEGTEAGRALADAIKRLEDYYGRGEPEVPPAPSAGDPPATVETRIPEAIIFGDERVTYDFVARALAASASVARLLVPRFVGGEWSGASVMGTGWLAAPGLVVTNHHVIAARSPGEVEATEDECRAQAAKTRAWFDYRVEGGARDEFAVAELVCMNAKLDYAIVRLQDGAGRKPLPIGEKPPLLVKGDRLNIVQHPRGGPLRFAIRSNHYVGMAGSGMEHLLRYLTDTEEGASGSPVLDDTWKVLALHRAATRVPAQRYGGQVTYVNNEGIAIHAILKDLPGAVRDEIATAQRWGTDDALA